MKGLALGVEEESLNMVEGVVVPVSKTVTVHETNERCTLVVETKPCVETV